MKALYFILISVTLIVQTLSAQQYYYPDRNWESKDPTALHMDAAIIQAAVTFAQANETSTDKDLRIANLKAYAREPGYRIFGPTKERGGPAGVILKDGYVIAQWGDVERVDMTFSVTKSYLSTVAGLAVEAGLIADIDDPVRKYVWDDTFESPHNAKITWRHLLTQSSDWSGCLFDFCDWADRPPRDGTIDDWRNRSLLEPGTNFEYNDVRVNLLAYCLTQVWRMPLPVVLKEQIMDPIGASTTWRWYGYDNSFVNVDGIMTQVVSGGGHFGGGMFINTLDHARFGLLIARNGKWRDQQLISADWVHAAQQPSDANPTYGLMWWLNTNHDLGDFAENIFYAAGFGGNFIVIDQEDDLVIVVRWLEPEKLGELVSMVLEAIE